MISASPSVTACIPHFRCRRTIRRAVESLLTQTYRRLTIVVVNDGDLEPPWRELAHLDDRRLVRVSLPANRGPYFATAAVLGATTDRYFLIQDADDWSAAERLSQLVVAAERERADFALSPHVRYREHDDGTLEPVQHPLPHPDVIASPTLRFHFSHHGLWRTRSLKQLGGYYGGFRFSYDLLLTNLLLLTGRLTWIDAPLYHYVVRSGSLTTSSDTGLCSQARIKTNDRLAEIYREAFARRTAFHRGAITSEQFTETVGAITQRYVTPTAAAELCHAVGIVAAALRAIDHEPTR